MDDNQKALTLIEQEATERTGRLDLRGLQLTGLPPELFTLTYLHELLIGVVWETGRFVKPQINADRHHFTQLSALQVLELNFSDLSDLDFALALPNLHSINCFGTQVSDLKPLQNLPNLQTLNCSHTEVGDLKPLQNLSNLHSLNCRNTQIVNLAPLQNLPNLHSFNCSFTQVANLACLQNLLNLHFFNCNFTKAVDLAPLKNLLNLHSLSCSHTEVSDLAPLQNLLNLHSLNCNGTKISSLKSLKDLQNLHSLNCNFAQIADLKPLQGLSNLHSLDCSHTKVSDLKPLQNLLNLQTLNCSHTKVSDLKPLRNLSSLHSLNCTGTQVKDLTPLQNLSSLHSLNCTGTQVKDLTPLQNLSSLHSLNCTGTQVKDLTPLQNLSELHSFDCSSTNVHSLKPVQNLTNLQTLNCTGTQVSDLIPLRNLLKLQSFDCENTLVSNLKPLKNLSDLQSLCCNNCPITSVDIPLALPNLKFLYVGPGPIPGIPPAGVLSERYGDNCLLRLRAHSTDLERGEVRDACVKLFILGNGGVGKTQITGRLCKSDFAFNPEWDSTHGIRIDRATLPTGDDKPLTLFVWDFGGQDIYHGTHALFLNNPAILALVWDLEAERRPRHGTAEQWFRDYPLSYWLTLAWQQGHCNSPIIPVQSKCDHAGQEAWRPPVDEGDLAALPFPARAFCLSTLTGHGWAGFVERLGAAANWMRDPARAGTPLIGSGRDRVRKALLDIQDRNNQSPAAERRRFLSMPEFRTLCGDDISSPDHLLTWLNAGGVVMYRPGLFEDRIVLDQEWVLDTIYAVFNRDKGALRTLKWLKGRFTRDLLATLVWQDFNPYDQDLFIRMMQSCDMCFGYRTVREEGAAVAEYIAPDLLPPRDDVAAAIDRRWEAEQMTLEAILTYTLLHSGLIRTILSKIGTIAGDDALYWQSGVLGFEGRYNSRFIIEQKMDSSEGWTGTIHICTQGGDAEGLLSRLLTMVADAQRRVGLKSTGSDTNVHKQVMGYERERAEAPLQMVREPQADRKWYVSYAWGDDTDEGKVREAEVDQLCNEAKARGINIERDKNVLRFGDSIDEFMQDLADGDRIFIVMSDAYLKSDACTHELLQTWRNSGKPEKFLSRVRLRVLECANIWKLEGRAAYADHWHDRSVPLDERLKKRGSDAMGEREYRKLKHMRACSAEIADILSTLAGQLHPTKWEDFIKHGFAD